MGNEVDIIIKAIDSASGPLSGVLGTFTGFNQALQLTQQALGYASQAFDATVGKFLDYSKQVQDLSRITGMSTEETSRLIQTSRLLEVTYTDLTQAARLLSKNGMVPNIETLAQLSDKYNSFTTAEEKAQWGVKMFGRDFQEMSKILEAGGDEIRKLASQTPQGLILKQSDIDSAKAYKQQLVELTQQWDAFAMEIGKTVVPAVTGLMYSLSHLHDSIYAEWKNGSLYIGTKNQIDEFNKESTAAYKVAQGVQNLADNYQAMGEQYLANAAAEKDQIAANDLNTQSQVALAEAQHGTSITTDDFTARLEQLRITAIGAAAGLDLTGQSAGQAADTIQGKLTQAFAALTSAQQNWESTVASTAVAAINDAKGLTDQQIMAMKGAVDAATGSTYQAQQKMQEDLATAVANFQKTGDIGVYQQAVQDIANKFQDTLAPGIKTANDEVTKLQDALNKLSNSVITTTVIVDVQYPNGQPPGGAPSESSPTSHGSTTSGGGTTNNTGSSGKGRAGGGLVTKPGVYPLAELGPELVIPANKTNQILNGGGNTYINNTFNNYTREAAAISNALAKAGNRKRVQVRMGG